MINHTPTYAIEIKNLYVRYHNNLALSESDMNVPFGSFSGVIGMNGAGKSTLFKVIIGLLKPTDGYATICGHTPQQAQKLGLVAYVPQSESVDWDFPVSVYDVVMMGRYGTQNIFRTTKAHDHKKSEVDLVKVGMHSFKDR